MPDVSARSRRTRLIDICCALPEVEADEVGKGHIKFSVRGRTVAYYTDNHHGDGMRALNCKAPPGMRDSFVKMGAERYFVPPYLGPKGWIALRLDLQRIDWDEVERLVSDSYRLVAPKTLVAPLEGEPVTARRHRSPRRR